jgi:hypothetical protein
MLVITICHVHLIDQHLMVFQSTVNNYFGKTQESESFQISLPSLHVINYLSISCIMNSVLALLIRKFENKFLKHFSYVFYNCKFSQ